MTIQPAFQMPERAPADSPIPAPTPGPRAPLPRMDVLVSDYQRLRADKDAMAAKHAAEMAPLREQLDTLNNTMLNVLNELGMDNSKTPYGTAYRARNHSYSIDDPAAYRAWVEQHGRPDFYENRASKEALDNHLAQGGELPPGVKVSTRVTVNVRK